MHKKSEGHREWFMTSRNSFKMLINAGKKEKPKYLVASSFLQWVARDRKRRQIYLPLGSETHHINLWCFRRYLAYVCRRRRTTVFFSLIWLFGERESYPTRQISVTRLSKLVKLHYYKLKSTLKCFIAPGLTLRGRSQALNSCSLSGRFGHIWKLIIIKPILYANILQSVTKLWRIISLLHSNKVSCYISINIW